MSNILIVRLSAIGDVAMTIPIIYSAAKANPNDSFTVLTKDFLIPLFINRPPNVDVIGVNTKATEKSFFGFLRYVFMLKRYHFDMVLDLHRVIRSRIVDFIFRLNGKRVFKIDKFRSKCKQLTAKPPKDIETLRPVIERYADVFRAAGFTFENTFISLYENISVHEEIIKDKNGYWVGIAPFAGHKGKIYPLEMMEKVVEALSIQDNFTIFLFGGRGEEEMVLKQWEEKYKNTVCMAGSYSLVQELELISRLDVMLSMDSANMHLASLVGTKVISIWGATHPSAGFYGYKQNPNYAVQVELPCRPCSIYGKKSCYRKDYACLQQIKPQQIINKLNFVMG